MAERLEHQRAIELLSRMDGNLLREAQCFFGGGTAVSLRCGEYRLSHDVDFLCASRDGYRLLRQRMFERDVQGLFVSDVQVIRDARVDRYGIRMAVAIDGHPIKLELVSEGRIDLAGVEDASLPIPRLTDADMVAEKLLANADRFLDDSSLGRDAIDLIVLEETLGGLPAEAWQKAIAAYGSSVESAWARALRAFRKRPERLARYLDAMSVLPETRVVITERLALLPAEGDDE